MPLPLPNLDDRRWTDLVQDGQAQIPRYAPQWTDYNLHDPGITLIDLFAWLAEMTDYRLNRVPPRHKLKFLKLLGFRPKGPQPASVLLSFAPSSATPPFLLRAGCEWEGTNPDAQVIPFRTLRALTVSPAVLEAVQVESGGTMVDRSQDFADHFPIQPLGVNPQPGDALYLGFNTLASGVPLALGFRFAGPGNDAAERRRLLEEASGQDQACRPVQPRFQCQPPAAVAPSLLPPHHSVHVQWEAFTGSGWSAFTFIQPPATAATGQVSDDTRSLTLDGIVELNPPAGIAQTKLGAVLTSLFYIRCRFLSGAFDAAPEILDIAVNATPCDQAVPVTQQFLIKAGAAVTGAAPAPGSTTRVVMTADARQVIQSLAFGGAAGPLVTLWAYTAPTASASGEIVIDFELAGFGTGMPDQQVTLSQAQVEVDSLELYTLSGSTWQLWQRHADFDASTRTDFHFVIDPATALITFGSGERGQAPAGDGLIFIRYRATAADAGNLNPGTINRPSTSPVNNVLLGALPAAPRNQLASITANRAAAINGSPAETLDDAFGKAVANLHAHEQLLNLATQNNSSTLDQIPGQQVRALVAPGNGVNLIDLERLALDVPGTRVDRAHAWSALHPTYPCLEAPGVVTIVIVPELPPQMPVPSPGLIDAVWKYLDRRRLVTTALQVSAPQYVAVTVTASARTRTGASPAKVAARITAALNVFLNPLEGGPNSLGWPFGRSVYRSEILSLIDSVPGVDYVISMSMQAGGGPPQCGDIALCPTALVSSGAHQIETS